MVETSQIIHIALRAMIVLGYCFMVIVANIGTSGLLCEFEDLDIVQAYPTPITPSSYAFIIWPAIFILQAFYALWAMLPADNHQTLVYVGVPLFVGMVAHGIWNIAFDCGHMILEAVMIMISLLAFAVAYVLAYARLPNRAHRRLLAYKRIEADESEPLIKYSSEVTAASTGTEIPLSQSRVVTELLVVFLPTAMSVAWLLVYAPMAVMIAAEQHRHIVIGAGAGIAVIVIVTVIGLAVALLLLEFVFSATLVWAWIAIAVQQSGNSAGHTAIAATIASGLAVLGVLYYHGRQFYDLYSIRQVSRDAGTY